MFVTSTTESRRTDPLRIGIDGRPLVGQPRGVGRYVIELCRQLHELLPDARFFFYSREPVELPIDSLRWIGRSEANPLARHLSPLAWLKLRCPTLVKRDDLDAFWGTNIFLPRLAPDIRSVSTIYDLSFELVPETYHLTHLLALRWFIERDLAAADALIAGSQGTADRLERRFGRSATAVITPAVDGSFRPQPADETRATLQELGVERPYLLTVATWEPRKNLSTLLEAWGELAGHDLVTGHSLVLVGKRSHKYRRESALLDQAVQNRVVDLGYVPHENLPALYWGAEALVFPSTYEGFGMPVLEARACGVPVLTTDLPELHEAGGGDALYVEPTVEGIRQGILEILRRPERPEPFTDFSSWTNQAQILADVLTMK